MLVMMYHMLRDGVEYQELGHDNPSGPSVCREHNQISYQSISVSVSYSFYATVSFLCEWAHWRK